MSSIGDIVLTTPVIRCLKQQINHVELHFLIKKSFLPVIEHNPYISRIHVYDGDLKQIIQSLKNENFDFVVDLHKNIRSRRIINALKVPFASFPKLNFKKWLLVNYNINILPDSHIIDRYFKAVQSLSVVNDGAGLDYFIPDKDEIKANDLPEGVFSNYIALVVGGAHFTKQIPVSKAVDICNLFSDPVIVCGGMSDYEKAVEIVSQSNGTVINACGKYNLNQSASLIKNAKKVITSDTGLMHIAAAFQKPIFSLWGNTVPEFGMYPYMPQHPERSKILEVKRLRCRPCSKIGYKKCPRKDFMCMMDMKIDKETFEF